MKTPEEAFEEWVGDEVWFEGSAWDREEFERLCEYLASTLDPMPMTQLPITLVDPRLTNAIEGEMKRFRSSFPNPHCSDCGCTIAHLRHLLQPEQFMLFENVGEFRQLLEGIVERERRRVKEFHEVP